MRGVKMNQPHKHAELIKAWADGAEIEVCSNGQWTYFSNPRWYDDVEYRIKPEPKPDVVNVYDLRLSVRLTFDGETCKLKNAEVLE
jgi:hypothetical protein